ncbi:MAG: acyl-CoA dehydrogenase family protein [Sphingobium sp.]
MDFEFSEEQQQFGEAARRLLAEQASSQKMRLSLASHAAGYDHDLWRGVADMGLLGIMIPERFGGLGLDGLELCVVAVEMGRMLPRIPWSSSVYFAAEMLVRAGTAVQQERWLPSMANGSAIGAYAEGPAPEMSGERLSSVLPVVEDGGHADFLILSTPEGAWLIDMTSAGVIRSNVETFDPLKPAVRIELSAVAAEPLPGASIDVVARVMERAAVATAFEQVGGAEQMLAMATAYAKDRKAFGRPIGTFQAVKALLADMYVAATLARSNAYYAAWTMAEAPDLLPKAAAIARLSATEAYRLCAANAIQVHGGIGFTWELDCHFHYRRAHALALALGGIRPWQEKFVEAMRAERQAGRGVMA